MRTSGIKEDISLFIADTANEMVGKPQIGCCE